MEGRSILDRLIDMGPIIQELVPEECAIAVCDLQQLLAYFPGPQMNHGVKVGNPLLPDSGMGQAIFSEKRIVTKVGPELFGFPYVVVAVPVRDQTGSVIGGISLSMSLEREDKLLGIARKLQDTMLVVNQTSAKIASAADGLIGQVGEMDGITRQMLNLEIH